MKKTEIFFVRHARSDFSIKDDWTRPLTEEGKKDSRRITQALEAFDISRIYSSPYLRAIDTLSDLAETLNLEIHKEQGFRERKVGEWVEDFSSFARKQWDDFSFKLPGGECLKEVQKRNILALKRVVGENQGEKIAIGTHGTALCTIINYFYPSAGFNFFQKIVDRTPLIIHGIWEEEKIQNYREIPLP